MRIISVITIGLVLFACKSNEEKSQPDHAAIPKTDTLPYYDFAEAIWKEVLHVNGTPGILIYKITEHNGKRDSVAIDNNQFTKLAAPFFELKLNKPEIKKEYKETVFPEPNTASYVFDYKTNNSNLPVKSVSVMVDTLQQNFKRADLMKLYTRNDTLFEERLAWTVGKKFQIIQIATAGNTELTNQTYVYWRERK